MKLTLPTQCIILSEEASGTNYDCQDFRVDLINVVNQIFCLFAANRHDVLNCQPQQEPVSVRLKSTLR